jgi:uncharacterized repeat protein (TIGR03803 family)
MTYTDISRLSILRALLLLISGGLVHAQTFSVLYNFGSAASDPHSPSYAGIVAQGRDGNLYSTGPDGGKVCCGALFQITPAGKLKNIHSFGSGGTDGAFPQGGVTLGTDGNFYGTTYEGGTLTAGAVFKVTPSGIATTLHSFTDGSDGGYPYAPPVEGNDGNFYGTATAGGYTGTGCGSTGCGTIYKITPSGAFTVLYQFHNTDGYAPYPPLVLGTDGNFYGMTTDGTIANAGVVFRITPAGKFTVLFKFDNTHGENPFSGLVQGNDGNFYGTTIYGGTTGGGVVFRITPTGKLSVLHSMNAMTDGRNPYGGLALGSDGNFYGANAYGGTVNANCSNGCGTVFRITPKGVYSVLYDFDYTTGATPYTTPFQHTSGVVYGTTHVGGTGNVNPCSTGNCGVFYSWTNAGLPPFVSLLPYWGKVGNTIEILGQGFTSKTVVSFNGTPSKANIVSGTYLTAAVPNGATTGSLTVTAGSVNLTSNRIFRVTPQLTAVSPASATVGTTVTLTGVSLKQTSVVTIGGLPAASFNVVSDTSVTAVVPAGAKTGQNIIVTTAGGSASTGPLAIPPKITSFSPTSGPVGTAVTIHGNTLTGASKVTFGGVAASSFKVINDTQLDATVPNSAKTGTIQVTTPGGAGTSPSSFTVN